MEMDQNFPILLLAPQCDSLWCS